MPGSRTGVEFTRSGDRSGRSCDALSLFRHAGSSGFGERAPGSMDTHIRTAEPAIVAAACLSVIHGGIRAVHHGSHIVAVIRMDAMTMLKVRYISCPSTSCWTAKASGSFSATWDASCGRSISAGRITNSTLPWRHTVSEARGRVPRLRQHQPRCSKRLICCSASSPVMP